MKTRLLRKIRRRFEIIHYPDGWFCGGELIKGDLYLLWDNNNEYGYHFAVVRPNADTFKTAKDCIAFLKERILSKVHEEYYQYSRKYSMTWKRRGKINY